MSALGQAALTTAVNSIPTPPPDGDDRSFFRNNNPAMNNIPNHNAHTAGGIVSPCAECGNDVVHPYLKELQQAQIRIAELEESIKTLTLRATTAMEKATEYETSLKRMNSLSSAGHSTPDPSMLADAQPAPLITQTPIVASPERAPSRGALSRLLPTRMPSLRAASSSPGPARRGSSRLLAESALPAEPPKQFPLLSHTPPTPSVLSNVDATAAAELQARLDQEQKLRLAAEADAEKTKSEIEELTASLFGQANKLVAEERKARDKLEKRVEVLERRDQEKTKRLSMLDMRVQRIERVRQVLSEKIMPALSQDDEGEESPTRTVAVNG